MTQKRKMMVILAMMMAGTMCFAQQGNTRKPCRTWIDPVLRVEFPERLAGMKLSERTTYNSGDLDYSLRYDSVRSKNRASGEQHLDIYIFTRDDKPMPDGVNDKVREQLDEASKIIRNYLIDVKALDMTIEGKLPKSGLTYEWTSFTLKFPENPKRHASAIAIFAWRNRFIKLRYSEPLAKKQKDAPCDTLPRPILDVLADLDGLIADAVKAAKVDIYAIANPTNALAALRRKWLGADQRISMAEMPDYESRFREMDDAQDWCNDDMEKRAETFEVVAREGIRFKIEPQIWYYNLACALARQKKSEPAFEALEQAIAAGYNESKHMLKDADLASIRNDVRFGKLAAIADSITVNWNAPKKNTKIVDGKLSLNEDNVYYAFNDRSYLVHVETDIEKPIIYLDHNQKHRPAPKGMIGVEFAREFHDAGRDIGPANIHFVDVRDGVCIPVVLASDNTYKEDELNRPTSLPAGFAIRQDDADREMFHAFGNNVLGVYAAGADYYVGGIDRFIGYFPACIAHAGGTEETEKLVWLCRDVLGVIPEESWNHTPSLVLNVIRRSQKCVTNEAAFMSGVAQRPVLSFADIDAEGKAKAMVLMNAVERFPCMPFFKDVALSFTPTPVSDLWNSPYDRYLFSKTCYNQTFIARWGERTATFDVEMLGMAEMIEIGFATNGWRYAWKVLQGDEKKVRIKAQSEDSAKVRIEVDYHKVFDAPLANGKTIKTSRVDVGCFLLNEHGVASVPAIFSVYFSPNETREYSADGKIVSIDYTKRQIAGWRPQLCAKGNWKDVFHYTDDGKMKGWTRFAPQEDGIVKTNEFTREGLVVMTRDALGRPKDVRRDMTMEWAQDFKGDSFTGDEYRIHGTVKGIEYDNLDYDPCGNPKFTTLAWQYKYKDDKDVFGEPSPKPEKPFTYRPELCRRADFTEKSGFRFPLMDQMMVGQARYAGYKYGALEDGDVRDLMRSDSPLALKKKGLTPPKVLKKMEFCPWKPSTNDLWRVAAEDMARFLAPRMVELADGVYRMRQEKQDGYLSVAETYSGVNKLCEYWTYKMLDREFKRGAKIDMKNAKTIVVTGAPLRKEELPEGFDKSLAYWHLGDKVLFSIEAFHNTGFEARKYIFSHDGDDDLAEISFQDVPSLAIGNTVLAAFKGDAKAMNNLAVLLYAEVANPGNYNEAAVIGLLKQAANRGCMTAKRNLEALRYNRGDHPAP